MKRLPLLLTLAFLAISAACAASPRAVTFAGVTYTYQGAQDSTQTYSAPNGKTLQIVQVDDDTGRIVNVIVDGKTYVAKGTEQELTVTFPDGRSLTKTYAENSSAGSADLGAPVTIQMWDQVDDLHEILFHTEQNRQSGARTQRLWIGALLFGIGLLQALKPRLAWQISEGWRYQNLEPSDLYLGVSRLAGVVLMLAALFVAFSQ